MPHVERIRGGYRVRYRLGGRGAPLKASGTYDRKDEAERAARRIADEMRSLKPAAPGDLVNLAALLLRWKKDRVAVGNDPAWTERTRLLLAAQCESRGWKTAADVTPEAVSKWRQQGGRARAGAYLRAFLWWCKDIAGQPVSDKALVALKPPRPKRVPARAMTSPDEIRGYLAKAEAMGASSVALIHCLATYGWRPISAAKMSVASIDLSGSTVTVEVKGGDTVRHPILPQTADLLRPIITGRKSTAPLFINPRTGEAFDFAGSRSISQWFRVWFDARVYDLKRAAISSMLNAGIAVHEAQTFTGHRTPGQLLRYARSNEATARAALSKITPAS